MQMIAPQRIFCLSRSCSLGAVGYEQFELHFLRRPLAGAPYVHVYSCSGTGRQLHSTVRRVSSPPNAQFLSPDAISFHDLCVVAPNGRPYIHPDRLHLGRCAFGQSLSPIWKRRGGVRRRAAAHDLPNVRQRREARRRLFADAFSRGGEGGC